MKRLSLPEPAVDECPLSGKADVENLAPERPMLNVRYTLQSGLQCFSCFLREIDTLRIAIGEKKRKRILFIASLALAADCSPAQPPRLDSSVEVRYALDRNLYNYKKQIEKNDKER